MSFNVFFFLFFFLTLAAICYRGAEPFSNFAKGLPMEHFCEIILKSVLWPSRRFRLKFFFSIF